MKLRPALLLCATSACAVYGSSLLLTGADGGDGGLDATPDAGRSCEPARWPERPLADDPSQEDLDLLTGLASFGLTASDDAGLGGYDLDSVCTCLGDPPEPESCVPVKGALQHCDLDAGRDNSGGALFSKFAQLGVLGPGNINSAIKNGSGSVLFRVQGYNGKPNDTQVSLSIYASNGTIPNDAGDRPPPDFDGGDRWTVDTNSVVGSTGPPYAPTYVDTSAYVTYGVLVGHIDFPFQIGTRSVSSVFVRLKGSVVVARLIASPSGWSLDGLMVGRWPTGNFLTALQGIGDPFDKTQHLCGDSGTYQTIKTQICRAADLTSDLQSDNKGAPCDAVSIAFSFRATPALFGPPELASPTTPPCGAAYTDDCR